jgi:hypothetical protein
MSDEELVVNIITVVACVLCFVISIFNVFNAELWWQKLISVFAFVVSIVSPIIIYVI